MICYCEQCEKELDSTFYEDKNGDYMCQDCMETSEARMEAAYDSLMDNKMDEDKLRRRL